MSSLYVCVCCGGVGVRELGEGPPPWCPSCSVWEMREKFCEHESENVSLFDVSLLCEVGRYARSGVGVIVEESKRPITWTTEEPTNFPSDVTVINL